MPNIVTSGGDGSFGGGGMWVFALLILAFLGLNNGGLFGGRGGDGVTPASGAAFTELNGRLDAIQSQVGHNNDLAELRALYTQACATDMNVTQQAFNVSNLINQTRTDTLLNFKDAALQQANCCCETNRNIDSVRFQNSQDTAAIITASNSNAQRILDKMCEGEITALRDELARERLASSQCAQNAYLVNQLRPYPQPTYASVNPALPAPPVYFGGYGYPYGGFRDGFRDGCCS